MFRKVTAIQVSHIDDLIDEFMRWREVDALVRAIPRSELPDSDDRAALVAALISGEVEECYRLAASDYHNVTIPSLPRYVDPRLRVTTWVQWKREGRDIRVAMLDEYTRRTMAAITASRQARQTRKEAR